MMDIPSLICLATGIDAADFERIVETAPRRYKVFEIPKRNGGMREIAQPARELKFIQRMLIDVLLKDLPVHGSSMAYRSGVSIKDNAEIHAGNGPILKLDFQDFFPSIRSSDWLDYCRRNNVLDSQNASVTSRLLFRKAKGERLLKLSIGAPSSPLLSNILMFDFDRLVAAEAEKRGIRYTRYADDLTFSGQRIGMLKDMLDVVPAAARAIRRPRLRLNREKTKFITASSRRIVTGITLSNDGATGLGHDRKRLIRAKVHHAIQGKLEGEALKILAGELAFANVAEPEFISRLRLKYGSCAIEQIQKSASY